MPRKGRQARRLVPLLLFALAACSDQALNLFFDIPPPTPQEQAAKAAEKAAGEKQKAKAAEAARAARGEVAVAEQDGEPPPIENIATWEQAAEMLPKDDLDEVDWMAALRQGIIKPRHAIGGARGRDGFQFAFDFYLPGPDPSMDALFPHSSHTQWLACASCHPKIFRVRGTEMTMDDIFEGKYCGACHGSIAFSLDNCTRCHTGME